MANKDFIVKMGILLVVGFIFPQSIMQIFHVSQIVYVSHALFFFSLFIFFVFFFRSLSGLSTKASQAATGAFVDFPSSGRNDELGKINNSLSSLMGKLEEKNSQLEISNSWLESKNEELNQTIEKLEEANFLKGLFSDIISHDLLNPVSSINITAQGELMREPENQILMNILDDSKTLIETIDNASKFSRLEDSKQLEKLDLDLNEIINKTVSRFRKLHRNGFHVENNLEGSMPIRANPIIEDIFINLIDNAYKYASEGKKVEIFAALEGDIYQVQFADFGGGISHQDKKTLFERFKRLDKEGVKGTGLGLAIVKRIVELHSGRVWIEDNPMGGTVFFVELPRGMK